MKRRLDKVRGAERRHRKEEAVSTRCERCLRMYEHIEHDAGRMQLKQREGVTIE
jgi:hypothetical protein